MQLPQLVTDRVAPQLSDPETVAQFLPSRAQKAASVSATQGTGPPLVPQPDAKRAATAAAAARKARRRFVVLDDARNEQRLSISVRLSSIMVRGIVESRDEPVNISMSGRIEHTEHSGYGARHEASPPIQSSRQWKRENGNRSMRLSV